jgi:hypothetical protein
MVEATQEIEDGRGSLGRPPLLGPGRRADPADPYRESRLLREPPFVEACLSRFNVNAARR